MVTICTNKNDIMNSVSDEEDLDIAHMSDFSDDEDGSQEEFRPGTQTGCVHDRSGDETLYWCDRPVAKTVTAKLCDKPADNLETMCVNDNDIMNSVSDDRDLDLQICQISRMMKMKYQRDHNRGHRPDVFWIVHLMRPCLCVIDRSLIR